MHAQTLCNVHDAHPRICHLFISDIPMPVLPCNETMQGTSQGTSQGGHTRTRATPTQKVGEIDCGKHDGA